MLYTEKLRDELARKRDQLASYQQRYGDQLAAYRAALAGLAARFPSASALHAVQAALLTSRQSSVPLSVGARPTAEYDVWRGAKRLTVLCCPS